MSYRVLFTDEALRNAEVIRDYLAERSPVGAERWLTALEGAIGRLEDNPFSCAVAPENQHAKDELRQALFKTPRGGYYRAVFFVAERTVTITHIRGPRQRPIPKDELIDI